MKRLVKFTCGRGLQEIKDEEDCRKRGGNGISTLTSNSEKEASFAFTFDGVLLSSNSRRTPDRGGGERIDQTWRWPWRFYFASCL
ncbi:uncharacterized protein J3R85_013615 [Psidium guajava]|nr:uncharacterized protein J3R85_013615 [Psidium guajava]